MAINLNELTNGSINRTEPTKPYWQGTAVFDVLMKSVNDNINIQYETNRITGADYAKVYLAGIETCIRESINFLLQKAAVEKDVDLKAQQILSMQSEDSIKATQSVKDAALKEAQAATALEDKRLKAAQATSYPAQATADLAVKTAQVELYNKQKAGFDDNRRQKLFEATVNSWALAYSSGILDTAILPSFINNQEMADLFNTIKNT